MASSQFADDLSVVEGFLRPGVLKHLTKLEEQVQIFARSQSRSEEAMKEIEQLRQRSRELQSRLSSINVDLVSLGALPVLDIDEETESSEEQEKTDSMTVLKKLKATVEGKDNQKQDEKSDEVDVDIANTVKETRLAARQFKFHQSVMAHRLTSGVTFFELPKRLPTSDCCVAIQWDTSFGGQFHECYYLILKDDKKRLRFHKHTLPYFVPVKILLARHLIDEPDVFTCTISRYLNAFVARRELVLSVEEALGMDVSGSLAVVCTRSTDAINFVEFDIGKRVNRPPLVSAPSARKRKRSDMSQEDSVRCNEVYFKIILRFLDNMQSWSLKSCEVTASNGGGVVLSADARVMSALETFRLATGISNDDNSHQQEAAPFTAAMDLADLLRPLLEALNDTLEHAGGS